MHLDPYRCKHFLRIQTLQLELSVHLNILKIHQESRNEPALKFKTCYASYFNQGVPLLKVMKIDESPLVHVSRQEDIKIYLPETAVQGILTFPWNIDLRLKVQRHVLFFFNKNNFLSFKWYRYRLFEKNHRRIFHFKEITVQKIQMRVYNRDVIYYTFSYYITRVYNGVIDHTPTVYIKLYFYIVRWVQFYLVFLW